MQLGTGEILSSSADRERQLRPSALAGIARADSKPPKLDRQRKVAPASRNGIRDFVFVLSGAAGVEGGVSAVNLSMLKVLLDLAERDGRGFKLLSYRESDNDRPPGLPEWVNFRGFRYAKFPLAFNILRCFSRQTLFLFDYLRLARPLLPLLLAGQAQVVVFAHGWDYWKRLRRLDAQILKHATLCLTNSFFTLRKMQERLPGFRGAACPLGLSPRVRLNPALPLGPAPAFSLTSADGQIRSVGERMLLLTGRMEPGERHKGHYPLLEVWPALLRRHPDVQLVLAGPGSDREALRKLSLEKGIGSSVFLPGHVSDELLAQLYLRSYAFVMPSLQEGFGLVYLEAMNYGKPCVGCWDQGAEDVIVHGETGLLLHDPWNREELLQVLRQLLENPEMAGEMGSRGFRRLHDHFTAERFQARFRQHLAGIL